MKKLTSFAVLFMVAAIFTLFSCKGEPEYVDKTYAQSVTFTTSVTTEGSVNVTMATKTEGAKIFYTIDGTDPTSTSTEYKNALVLSKDTVIKAIAVKDGMENSPVSVASVSVVTKTITVIPEGQENAAMQIALTVPAEKSNTSIIVTAKITTANAVKRVVYKKNGSEVAKKLLADSSAKEAAEDEVDNSKWTFTISAKDETANGTYTVAAIDNAGREEAEQITISNFDFTAPARVSGVSGTCNEGKTEVTLNWTNPTDTDFHHVEITYTSNDGSSNSTESTAESVTGTTKSFTVDSTKQYYTYSIVSVDALGNRSTAVTHKVGVAQAVTNVPAGFVSVEGSTVTGGTKFALTGYTDDYFKGVFREGRTVTIDDFFMCDHEVTQAEFLAVMGTNPSSFSSSPASGEEQTNRPVENVNWYMAIAYCNKKSVAEGLTPCYTVSGITDWANLAYSSIPTSNNSTWNAVTCNFTANGYRLPTEAEWEYAALGGKNGVLADNPTDYSGTNDSTALGTYAWYSSNSDNKTHEVKKKEKNALNLYDMSGNVWEWCWDWYDTDNEPSITSETPAAGASSGSYRVGRGGSYYYDASYCSVAYRYHIDPATATTTLASAWFAPLSNPLSQKKIRLESKGAGGSQRPALPNVQNRAKARIFFV